MSGGQSGYELSEAKAILTELKSIRKAISSGEKEKQDLMQVCHGASVSICWAPGRSPLVLIMPTELLQALRNKWRMSWFPASGVLCDAHVSFQTE